MSETDIIQSHTGEADKEAMASVDVADGAQTSVASHTDKHKRKMTEKGLSAMKCRLFDSRARLVKSIHRKMNRMISLAKGSDDATEYKKEYEIFNNTVAELMSIHNQYKQLLNPEEHSADEDIFDEEDWTIQDLKTEAIKYL